MELNFAKNISIARKVIEFEAFDVWSSTKFGNEWVERDFPAQPESVRDGSETFHMVGQPFSPVDIQLVLLVLVEETPSGLENGHMPLIRVIEQIFVILL